MLISIKELCKTTTDVIELINKIFSDIESKKELVDFSVAQELKAGFSGAVVDALILEPNAFGMGINLKKIINFFSKKK